MMNAPLFSLATAEDTILITPVRDLSEFEFVQLESEAAEILGQISKDGGPHVVVDFSRIRFCGSTALGFFTSLFKKTRCRGGEMAFCNVSPEEREVLHLMRLDTLWPICDSLDEALETVRGRHRRESPATWIVVADRAIARVFEQCGDENGPLKHITTLRHPESRERMSDVVSDNPGSFRGGGIAGSEAGEPNQDYRHHTARLFARRIAGYLDAERQRGEFGQLVLIAAPLFLGSLRSCLSPPLRQMVKSETARDYTHLDGNAIHEHVRELVGTT